MGLALGREARLLLEARSARILHLWAGKEDLRRAVCVVQNCSASSIGSGWHLRSSIQHSDRSHTVHFAPVNPPFQQVAIVVLP